MERLTLDKPKTLSELLQAVANLVAYSGDTPSDSIPLDCEIELWKSSEGLVIKVHGVGSY